MEQKIEGGVIVGFVGAKTPEIKAEKVVVNKDIDKPKEAPKTVKKTAKK